MSSNLLEGIGAMAGVLPIKHLAVVKTDNKKNIELLEERGGPIPYICCSVNPGAYGKGIMRVTDSATGHAGLFVGKQRGQQIRVKHPDLLSYRQLPEDEWQGHILMPIPRNVLDYEIIESQALINTNTFSNAIKDGEQVIAFIRDFSDSQIDAILYAAYYMYGAPYDIFEIAKWIFPFIPNPNALKVCSSYVECALEGERPDVRRGNDYGDISVHDWLETNGYDPEKVSPGALGKYLFSNSLYTPIAFNCDIKEAKEKI